MKRRDFLQRMSVAGVGILCVNNAPVLYGSDQKSNKKGYPVEDFPAIVKGRDNTLWMATVKRERGERFVYLCQSSNGTTLYEKTFSFDKSVTGIGAPALVITESGCVITFSIEMQNQWTIAYSFLEGKQDSPRLDYIGNPNCTNINPALGFDGTTVHLVWESNAGQARGVYACSLSNKNPGDIIRLSSLSNNSYNPSITALGNGQLFTAWDSFRNRSCNIYGSSFKKGSWKKEKQLTFDARLERHPTLTAWKGDLWMAWQAQSYDTLIKDSPGIGLNNLDEQRIVVAKIAKKGFYAPHNLFNEVSPKKHLLQRPNITFDDSGRLWVSARKSIHANAGWQAKVWCYSQDQWTSYYEDETQQGRWRPISIVVNQGSVVTAVQRDNLPTTWDETRGVHPGWKSEVTLLNKKIKVNDAKPLKTIPLEMPKTGFSIHNKVTLCAAELPRQKYQYKGKELNLYFGDLHDHTDISVCVRDKNPPGHDLYANLRDIEKLDFCAITDHGYNFDNPQWQLNGEQTRYNHDPGRFVTFLGQEWTSDMRLPAGSYGHRNLIFLDPHFDKFFDAHDGDLSPTQLWKNIKETDFICIPHQLADWEHMVHFKGKAGNPPTDWHYVDESHQPVAEIFQIRGSYEHFGCPRQAPKGAPFHKYYLQDVWKRGTVIGVIASPDHGGGFGKAGVWAESLTRESLFKAIKARHTFGTTGAKMGLLLTCNDTMMGDKAPKPSDYSFSIKVKSLKPIKEVVLFRNNSIVYQSNPHKEEVALQWTDQKPIANKKTWYYARVIAEDNEIAWSSPIWFV